MRHLFEFSIEVSPDRRYLTPRVIVRNAQWCGRTETLRKAMWLWRQPLIFTDPALGEPLTAACIDWTGVHPLHKKIRVVDSHYGDTLGYIEAPIRMGRKPFNPEFGAAVQRRQDGGKGTKDWHDRPSTACVDFMAALMQNIVWKTPPWITPLIDTSAQDVIDRADDADKKEQHELEHQLREIRFKHKQVTNRRKARRSS